MGLYKFSLLAGPFSSEIPEKLPFSSPNFLYTKKLSPETQLFKFFWVRGQFFSAFVVSGSSRRTHYWARPSQNSGRAAFPHPALHAANHLTNLWVSVSFLLEINFLIISISEYWISFPQKYRHMQLPSLLRYYPHSSVLWSCPTTCISFAFLLLLLDIPSFYTFWKENTGSPQLTRNPCVTWIVPSTPQSHVKSRHYDKPVFYLPLR